MPQLAEIVHQYIEHKFFTNRISASAIIRNSGKFIRWDKQRSKNIKIRQCPQTDNSLTELKLIKYWSVVHPNHGLEHKCEKTGCPDCVWSAAQC